MIKIIGLTGPAGCGKDTVAHYLCQSSGFVSIALADPLRAGLTAMLGITHDDMHNRQRKEQAIDWLGRSPRQLLQTLGTEWGRHHVASDIWLRVAERAIEKIKAEAADKYIAGIVISDIRFANEAEWLRKAGGELWHVWRGDHPALNGSTAQHASEQGIPPEHQDRLICNTSTLDDLEKRVFFAAQPSNEAIRP